MSIKLSYKVDHHRAHTLPKIRFSNPLRFGDLRGHFWDPPPLHVDFRPLSTARVKPTSLHVLCLAIPSYSHRADVLHRGIFCGGHRSALFIAGRPGRRHYFSSIQLLPEVSRRRACPLVSFRAGCQRCQRRLPPLSGSAAASMLRRNMSANSSDQRLLIGPVAAGRCTPTARHIPSEGEQLRSIYIGLFIYLQSAGYVIESI